MRITGNITTLKLLEVLRKVNHTLTLHGKMDAETDLHDLVIEAIANIEGLGIEAKSPEAESRGLAADSPADRQPPENEVITPEALEREGWEKIADYGNIVSLVKRPLTIEINITSGEFWLLVEGRAKGVKTMQDLITLTRLVNG